MCIKLYVTSRLFSLGASSFFNCRNAITAYRTVYPLQFVPISLPMGVRNSSKTWVYRYAGVPLFLIPELLSKNECKYGDACSTTQYNRISYFSDFVGVYALALVRALVLHEISSSANTHRGTFTCIHLIQSSVCILPLALDALKDLKQFFVIEELLLFWCEYLDNQLDYLLASEDIQ